MTTTPTIITLGAIVTVGLATTLIVVPSAAHKTTDECSDAADHIEHHIPDGLSRLGEVEAEAERRATMHTDMLHHLSADARWAGLDQHDDLDFAVASTFAIRDRELRTRGAAATLRSCMRP